jgi:phenylpropionate dioxygenase-like ring-hydroxylating dioxygenase large terminal subunit
MFLRNCWYVAAWDSEIGREPFARTIVGDDVVMFRTEDGTPAALEDRCCHRNMPLSMGRLSGDNIRCMYHGLVYDAAGTCVEVPGQTELPPGARVKSYPVVEKWALIWIWMGEPALADAEQIPDWFYLDHPDWVAARGNHAKPIHMKCYWELNNDNLLDLSHVAYLHETTLGGPDITKYPIETERLADGVRMSRLIPDTPPTPIFASYLGLEGNVDRWQISEVTAPTHCVVDAGLGVAVGTGTIEGDQGEGLGFRALITATPETETTTFMFYAQVRNFGLDNETLTETFTNDFYNVFLDDVGALEAQQRVMERHPDAPTIDIKVDAPHLAMRQLIGRLIEEERQ